MIFCSGSVNFITATEYLRIGETLIPDADFLRNPVFVLFCTREFQMQQDLPFSIGFHTLFFLFTGCVLPVSSIFPYASPGSYSVVPRFKSFRPERLHGALPAAFPDPAVYRCAARRITAYLSELILFSAELLFMDCTPVLVRFIHPHHASVF